MDFESVKKYLENYSKDTAGAQKESTIDSMPRGFIEPIVMQGLRIDRIERGRVRCSFTVSNRIVNDEGSLHSGALVTMAGVVSASSILTLSSSPSTGVSVELNVSYFNRAYLGEEIEIESRALHVGKAFAAVDVEFRSKKTGKIIAQARHTKYLPLHSKI